MNRLTRVFGSIVMVGVPMLLASAESTQAVETRFVPTDELVAGPTAWLSVDGDRVAFGSERRISVAGVGPPLRLHSSVYVDLPISGGVLVDNGLYVVQGASVLHLDLDTPLRAGIELALNPVPQRELLIARMPDHLVVAESGVGIRLLALPPPRDMRHADHGESHVVATQVGFLRLDETILALATSGSSVFAALDGGRIAIIEARDVEVPVLESRLSLNGDIEALTANGPTLYALGSVGLRVVDVTEGVVTATVPGIAGSSLDVAGRHLLVGVDEGLAGFRDVAPTMATIFVTVGNFFFAPENVSVAVGDTVQWDFAGGPFSHNVEACDETPPPAAAAFCGANGSAAEGFFTSGPPTTSPFTFQQTFTVPGSNPYYCILHVQNPGMVGSVTVAAAPPGVPDGIVGAPVEVAKVAGFPEASRLAVSWDTVSCTPVSDHHFVFGFGSGLPGALGGSYTLDGSQCNIGGVPPQPFIWSAVPDPAVADPSSRLLWFLVLTKDNETTEGSWGQDSTDGERNGATASGQCTVTGKNLSNLCGQ